MPRSARAARSCAAVITGKAPQDLRECNHFTSIMMFQASFRWFYTSPIATNTIIPGRLGEANPESRGCGARFSGAQLRTVVHAFRVPGMTESQLAPRLAVEC